MTPRTTGLAVLALALPIALDVCTDPYDPAQPYGLMPPGTKIPAPPGE
jgi:hypothetical protein